MIKVLKFGGTSVQNSECIRRVGDIIQNLSEKSLIVVSAMSGITDKLLSLAVSNNEQRKILIKEIENKHLDLIEDLNLGQKAINILDIELNEIKEIADRSIFSPKEIDTILSKGEILSSNLIQLYLESKFVNISHLDSREVIITDDNYNEAEIEKVESYTRIKERCEILFETYDVIICGGFIASNKNGITTTLGRGGSDFTASIYSAALKAKQLEIWTDVDGILTCDPRVIKNTKRILRLSYSEASELSFFGAKVLHPKTIYPAIEDKITVIVKNTFNPEKSGTYILPESENIKMIKAIAFRKNITTITISSNRMLGAIGFLSRVFQIFEKYKTSVDIVTTSEVSISVTIDNITHLENIKKELESLGNVDINHNKAIIAAIGEGIKLTAGIAGKFFGVLKGVNIYMVSVGASEVNLSIVIDEENLEKTLLLLHDEFFNENLDKNIFTEL